MDLKDMLRSDQLTPEEDEKMIDRLIEHRDIFIAYTVEMRDLEFVKKEEERRSSKSVLENMPILIGQLLDEIGEKDPEKAVDILCELCGEEEVLEAIKSMSPTL